ncbi:tripartite tricarboxylate transporter substrate binding protein [Variovorax sp. YR752]|uniref:Bug family tripartite tricarboxylate transporter substrate binding protein n=1 Tax=Variovorax sp. YR752 TaxID=1884383 RepID=UPI003138376B
MDRRTFLATAVMLATTATAMAQQATVGFPSRPVRIVVPYPAGGNTDAIARTIGMKLSEIWKSPVIVENKPGANSMLGTGDVIRAASDGHTILANISLIVQNTFAKDKLPFDTFKELQPLIAATETPMYFVVGRKDGKISASLEVFLQEAKSKPGAKSFGSFGNGSTGHLLLLGLERSTSADITHVPFKGSADVIVQVLNGQVSSTFLPYSAIAPHLATGKIKILAVTGNARSPFSPDVPTFEERGIKGFTASQWNGYFISRRTPLAITQKLVADFDAAIRSPEVSAKLKQLGLSPVGGTPEKFEAMIDQDFALTRAALKDNKLKFD